MVNGSDAVLSFETFAAKDIHGRLEGFMLVVPPRCGLKQADSLRLSGSTFLALHDRSVLPLTFAELTPAALMAVLDFSRQGKRLPVAEFTASGLLDSYFLTVVVS